MARDDACAGKDSPHIQIEHAVDVCVRGLEQRSNRAQHPGIVHEPIDMAETRNAALQQLAQRRIVEDIDLQCQCGSAGLDD